MYSPFLAPNLVWVVLRAGTDAGATPRDNRPDPDLKREVLDGG